MRFCDMCDSWTSSDYLFCETCEGKHCGWCGTSVEDDCEILLTEL